MVKSCSRIGSFAKRSSQNDISLVSILSQLCRGNFRARKFLLNLLSTNFEYRKTCAGILMKNKLFAKENVRFFLNRRVTESRTFSLDFDFVEFFSSSSSFPFLPFVEC